MDELDFIIDAQTVMYDILTVLAIAVAAATLGALWLFRGD